MLCKIKKPLLYKATIYLKIIFLKKFREVGNFGNYPTFKTTELTLLFFTKFSYQSDCNTF